MKTTVEERWRSGNVYAIKMSKIVALICLFLGIFPQSAFAKFEGTFSCKSEQMIVVRSDMSVVEKGFTDEFLVDVGKEEFTLRFPTGQKISYTITAETPYGITSHEPKLGDTYSFFFQEKLVERLFYTRTISTAFDTELRTGFCKKFG